MASNRFKTTITKKDGTTASGYIENDRGYYDDGTALSAGDSIVDAQNKVWTKGAGNVAPGIGEAITGLAGGLGITVPDSIKNAGSSASYSVGKAEVPSKYGRLRSSRELANLFDINYDMDAIRSIYDDATAAKYALLSKELEQGENDFYVNNAQSNATLLDTLKKATSSAIATGASRGIAGAEQLGLMMEAQQNATAEATALAQERANMADEIALEKANNIINAMEYSNKLKETLAGISSNVYSADTQYDVGLLDFAVNNRNVDALLQQINAEADTNTKSMLYGLFGDLINNKTTRDEGEANRKAQKEMNDATIAGNKEAAAITAAGYKASGGSGGSGYNNDYISQVLQAQKYMEDARKAGDIAAYETWRMVLNALTNNPNEGRTDIFDIVNKDPYFKNSNAWEASQKTALPPGASLVTNTTGSVDVMTLRNYASHYGTNSSEFKQMYNKANKIVQRTFDNNYR